jgi:hypothetical protein
MVKTSFGRMAMAPPDPPPGATMLIIGIAVLAVMVEWATVVLVPPPEVSIPAPNTEDPPVMVSPSTVRFPD